MSTSSASKQSKPVPDVPVDLLKRSDYFTVRERHPLTRRLKYVHLPLKDFHLDRFDETYEIVRPINNYPNRKHKIGWV